MNLRHIDPGSTDWMDAMLEGELERANAGTHRKRDVDQQGLSEASPLIPMEMMTTRAVAEADTGQQSSPLPAR